MEPPEEVSVCLYYLPRGKYIYTTVYGVGFCVMCPFTSADSFSVLNQGSAFCGGLLCVRVCVYVYTYAYVCESH